MSYLALILNRKAIIIVIYPISVFFFFLFIQDSCVNKTHFIDKLS